MPFLGLPCLSASFLPWPITHTLRAVEEEEEEDTCPETPGKAEFEFISTVTQTHQVYCPPIVGPGRSQGQYLVLLCLNDSVLREFLGRLSDRLLPEHKSRVQASVDHLLCTGLALSTYYVQTHPT